MIAGGTFLRAHDCGRFPPRRSIRELGASDRRRCGARLVGEKSLSHRRVAPLGFFPRSPRHCDPVQVIYRFDRHPTREAVMIHPISVHRDRDIRHLEGKFRSVVVLPPLFAYARERFFE